MYDDAIGDVGRGASFGRSAELTLLLIFHNSTSSHAASRRAQFEQSPVDTTELYMQL